jgi:hypothetical protein
VYYSPSADNAQRLLRRYLVDKAKVDRAKQLQSVALTGMPKQKSSRNSKEQQLAEAIDMQRVITDIDAAVEKLASKPKALITFMYLTPGPDTPSWVALAKALRLPYLSDQWHDYLNVALEAFAEVYQDGELQETANQDWEGVDY